MNINENMCLSPDNDIKPNCILRERRLKVTDEFDDFYKPYELAIDEIKDKLELIANELEVRFQRNPIYILKSRLKTPSGIINKLTRRGLDTSLFSAKKNLTDIAGIKVVCDYIDDVYLIEELLLCQKGDFSIIKKVDYIKNPKDNGYRSLHIIIMFPVFVSGIKENIPVEIQMRSLAMDFWASLEHQICYKRGCDHVPAAIIKRLKDCADIIASVDAEMQNINKDLEIRCSKDVTLE